MVTIHNLCKNYGKKQALSDINLEIPNGMFGLLGKNGAGKTTLMKIIASLIPPTAGECQIDGISVREKKKIRKMIGYLPQEFSFYPDFTCFEMLDYLLLLENKQSKEYRKEKIFEILEKVNLQDQVHTKVKYLSGGMKRRLGVAQAVMSDPKVIIVDEPTAGLDPGERVHLRNLLCSLAENKAVILSTHIVSDIEGTCGNIAVLQAGSLVYTGDTESFRKKAQGHVWSVTMDAQAWEQMQGKLGGTYAVSSLHREGSETTIRFVSEDKLLEQAVQAEAALEDAYLYRMLKKG